MASLLKNKKVAAPLTPESKRSNRSNAKAKNADSNVLTTPQKGSKEVVERTPLKSVPSTVKVSEDTKAAYSMVTKATGSLGGNGSNGAIYGELTISSMQRIIDILKDECEMDRQSMFIDVGSGLGKPNYHAASDPHVRISIGIELEHIRWQMSMHILLKLLQFRRRLEDISSPDAKQCNVNFFHGDIDTANTMDPFTHIYMYDLGFPPDLQKSIATKFNTSYHAQYLVSYRPPRRVIREYGYHVEYLLKTNTSMHGSGEGHTAYFYRKVSPSEVRKNAKTAKIPMSPTASPTASSEAPDSPQSPISISPLTPVKRTTLPNKAPKKSDKNTVLLPARDASETDKLVFCDPAFKTAVLGACGPMAALEQTCQDFVTAHLSEGKPTRIRKPRKLDF